MTATFYLFAVILSYIISAVLDLVFLFLLKLANIFTETLLSPFTFMGANGYDLFAGAVGANAMNAIQNIAIGMGLAFSILFFLFSLLKVFYGRYGQDAPDPLKTCVRFIFAIIFVYWGSTLLIDYIFPFAQQFINQALNLDNSNTVTLADSIINTANHTLFNTNIQSSFDNFQAGAISNAMHDLLNGTIQNLLEPFNVILELLALIICLIAVFVNIFKIALENAERYFTTILLTIFAPVAGATLVNEKTAGVFKAWCQMLTANILTILFNVLGMKLLIGVFANVATQLWTAEGILSTAGLLGIIIIVAFSKMVQKMDQLLSQLTFKINPIQNRSLIMGALGTVGGLAKSGKAFSDMATGRGPLMNTINHFKNKNSPETKAATEAAEKKAADAKTKQQKNDADNAIAIRNQANQMPEGSAKQALTEKATKLAGQAGAEAMAKAEKSAGISAKYAIDRISGGTAIGETGKIDLPLDGINADDETLDSAASQIVAGMQDGEKILPTESNDGFTVINDTHMDYNSKKALSGDSAVQAIKMNLANGSNAVSQHFQPNKNKKNR